MQNLDGSFRALIVYYYTLIFSAEYFADIELDLVKSGLGIKGSLDISGTKDEKTGRTYPSLKLSDFHASLSKKDVAIKVHKSSLGTWVNWFSSYIVDAVVPLLTNTLNDQLPTLWNEVIAGFMGHNEGLIDTGFANLGIDIGYSAAPSLTSEHMQLFLNGQVFNTKTGEAKAFAKDLPEVTVNMTQGSALNLAISQMTASEITHFLHDSGVLDVTLGYADINIADTNDMELFFPGVIDRYGKEKEMKIRLNTWKAPEPILAEETIQVKGKPVKKGKIGLDTFFDITIMGELNNEWEEAIHLRVGNANSAFDLDIENFTVNLQLREFIITKVDTLNSKIGDQEEQDTIDLLNSIIPKVIDPINSLLKPFPFPKKFFGVEFTDLEIIPRDGYLYAALACDFSSKSAQE